MLLVGLTIISLPSHGFFQNASTAPKLNSRPKSRAVKTRPAEVIPFRLQSSDFVLKLMDSISSASTSGPVSSFIYAQAVDPVYDASRRAVIPDGKMIKLRYTVTPGKSFHRQRGELMFHVEPVEIEFGGRPDPDGWTIGIWEIRLYGTLHAVTIKGSGIPIRTDGNEGHVAARRSTSPPLQAAPTLGNALAGIVVLPSGPLIYGLTSVGENMARLAFGKREAYLPEGSTLHFILSSTAEALYLGPSSTVRSFPISN
jgi:hypothetical protein